MSEISSPETDREALSRAFRLFWSVAVLAFLADQASKEAALAFMDRTSRIPILPGLFELRLEFNPGAAFSLFVGGRWFFVGVSAAALVFLPSYLRGLVRGGEHHRVYPLALGLILGGAMGNALDRCFRPKGYVVDFFHAYWGKHSFPVFNVADSAITVGLGVLLLAMFLIGERETPPTEEQGEGESNVAGSVQDRQL